MPFLERSLGLLAEGARAELTDDLPSFLLRSNDGVWRLRRNGSRAPRWSASQPRGFGQLT